MGLPRERSHDLTGEPIPRIVQDRVIWEPIAMHTKRAILVGVILSASIIGAETEMHAQG